MVENVNLMGTKFESEQGGSDVNVINEITEEANVVNDVSAGDAINVAIGCSRG